MGYAKDQGLTWAAPLEWAKGSPLRQPGVDSLDESTRLQMAAIVANQELSFFERRVASAYRNPKDLSRWLTAGVGEWGVDPKFAPMRALSRAKEMKAFLRLSPADTDAARAWRVAERGQRGRELAKTLRPSNAHTLAFKRRAMPEIALAAIATKGAWSAGALTVGAALWPIGGGAAFIGGVFFAVAAFAKMAEAGFTDHERSGEKQRELWAMRKAVCSDWRVQRLARAALEQAKALGYAGADQPVYDGGGLANGRPPEELFKEAKALEAQRAKLLGGGLLNALDRGEEAARMRQKAEALKEAAKAIKESKRSVKEPDAQEIERHLSAFAQRVYAEILSSKDTQTLKAKSVARVEGAEIKKATERPLLAAPIPEGKPRASRL